MFVVVPLIDGAEPRPLKEWAETGAFQEFEAEQSEVHFVAKTCTSQESAELFSLSSSLSSGRKHFWFSNLRNRDGISTRRLNVGVFTQPRPIPEAALGLVVQHRDELGAIRTLHH